MSQLQNLYKQVVLEHSRKPRHYGVLPHATHIEGGHNPSCGDQLQLMLQLEGERIQDIGFTSQGCAISTASASLMMGLVKGKTVDEARELAQAFKHMIRTGEVSDELGDAAALQGIHDLPTRVKCATLVWQTLEVLLERLDDATGQA